MWRSMRRVVMAGALALAGMAAQAAAIAPFGADGMERIAAAMKGKPFVLIVWSLDCEFCRASMDTLAQERKAGRKLEVVTVSTDALTDPVLGPMMDKRLAQLKMRDGAWAFGDLAPERLRYAIDPRWHGEKPRSYWFNAAGERTAYSGVITPQIIEKFYAK